MRVLHYAIGGTVLVTLACNLLEMPDDSVSGQKAAELKHKISAELRAGVPRADVVKFLDRYVPEYTFDEVSPEDGGAPCYGGTAYVAPGNASAVIFSLCLSQDQQTYAFSNVEIHYTWF